MEANTLEENQAIWGDDLYTLELDAETDISGIFVQKVGSENRSAHVGELPAAVLQIFAKFMSKTRAKRRAVLQLSSFCSYLGTKYPR